MVDVIKDILNTQKTIGEKNYLHGKSGLDQGLFQEQMTFEFND